MPTSSRNIGLVYYRTSTHEQFKKVSPELQLQKCLAMARNDHCDIDETRDLYWDDESAFLGKGGKRPGFQRLTERWQTDPRIRTIYIYDMSRLFRDARAYFNYAHDLKARGVELASVVEPLLREDTPAAKLPAGIIALVNEYNSALYGNKIRDAMRFKAASGVYPTKAPFGYRNVRSEDDLKNRAWIEVDENTAPWVTRAFILYASGNHSLRSAAETLTAEGFPTKGGRVLHPSVLGKLLQNKAYIGWVEWGEVSTPNGQHAKLVEQTTFDRVQTILAAHNQYACRQRRHTFPLRGAARCAECGSRLQASYSRGQSGRYYGFYHCQKVQRGLRVACSQPSTPITVLDGEFERLLDQCELSAEGLSAVKQRIQSDLGDKQRVFEESKRGMERSLKDVTDAKKKALLIYATGVVDTTAFEAAMKVLCEQEAVYAEKLARLEGDLSTLIRVLTLASELAEQISKAYGPASPGLRALLVSTFFERFDVSDHRIQSAALTAPFEYVCSVPTAAYPVFQLAPSCGVKRSLLEHLLMQVTPAFVGRIEKAHAAVFGSDELSLAA
jgi:site-specific DNA recombinase